MTGYGVLVCDRAKSCAWTCSTRSAWRRLVERSGYLTLRYCKLSKAYRRRLMYTLSLPAGARQGAADGTAELAAPGSALRGAPGRPGAAQARPPAGQGSRARAPARSAGIPASSGRPCQRLSHRQRWPRCAQARAKTMLLCTCACSRHAYQRARLAPPAPCLLPTLGVMLASLAGLGLSYSGMGRVRGFCYADLLLAAFPYGVPRELTSWCPDMCGISLRCLCETRGSSCMRIPHLLNMGFNEAIIPCLAVFKPSRIA